LTKQFGEQGINSLGALDLIMLAKQKGIEPILKRYKENAEKDIERMKFDIDEFKDEALKYNLLNSIFFNCLT
jgi:hypothetical protein